MSAENCQETKWYIYLYQVGGTLAFSMSPMRGGAVGDGVTMLESSLSSVVGVGVVISVAATVVGVVVRGTLVRKGVAGGLASLLLASTCSWLRECAVMRDALALRCTTCPVTPSRTTFARSRVDIGKGSESME